ncbi:MAG: MazG nucleotide pyrophosphohydrolase domain-containing protein [bacterium]
MDKIKEETREVEDALALYLQFPTPENLIALKTEIGDQLFAIICFTNNKDISPEECFNLMMDKNRKRFKEGYTKEEK